MGSGLEAWPSTSLLHWQLLPMHRALLHQHQLKKENVEMTRTLLPKWLSIMYLQISAIVWHVLTPWMHQYLEMTLAELSDE
jgi:hypothetical protein